MVADEMHPEARAALDRREKLGLVPVHDVGRRRLRLAARVTSWWENRDPPPVGATRDRTIPGPDGGIPVRVYEPDRDGRVPTVVFLHGGGYVFGGLATHDLLCRHLVRESGCAVVAVDYRLAPEHPFPAAVEDAYAAVEWAAANPGAVGGDGRLAVAGDSAGGALATIAALMAAERDGPALDYQVLLYPGVGVEEGQASLDENDGVVLTRADLEWFRDCYFGSDVHLRNPYAEPTNAADLSGLPPATVVTAGFDPLRDGGRRYADRLASDGVAVRHVEYDDMVHGFATMLGRSTDLERAHELVADVGGDLEDAFADA